MTFFDSLTPEFEDAGTIFIILFDFYLIIN